MDGIWIRPIRAVCQTSLVVVGGEIWLVSFWRGDIGRRFLYMASPAEVKEVMYLSSRIDQLCGDISANAPWLQAAFHVIGGGVSGSASSSIDLKSEK